MLHCDNIAAMSATDLTILVIDENAIRASIIEEGLREAGHARVTIIKEVNGVARTIETLRPDVIVIDIENPNRDMMEHLFQLTRTVAARLPCSSTGRIRRRSRRPWMPVFPPMSSTV